MLTLKELEEQVNKGVKTKVVTHLSVKGEKRVRAGLSSGSMMLNLALSGTPNVGFAWGRIIELYGPEMSGKTTLAFHCIHETQKLKLPAMYIDAEHTVDPVYAAAVGINLEKLSFVQPDFGEQSLETVIQAVKAGYKLIVIDSVAALIPLAELEGDMGDAHIGRQARMMGQGLRKMAAMVTKQKAIVIFINQIRMKIGMMFGNPETTPGGKALKFFASYRLEIRAPRGGKIEEKTLKETVEHGIKANVKIVKNKLYPPFRKAEFDIIYGRGIDKAKDFVNFLEVRRVFKPDKKGTLRITVNGKGYTKKTLLVAIREDETVKRTVIEIGRLLKGSKE